MSSIEQLRNLAPGWLDGYGEAPSKAALDCAQRILSELAVNPALFPVPDGSVQAEFDYSTCYVEIHFSIDGTQVECFASDFIRKIEERSVVFSTVNITTAEQVGNWLKSLLH